MISRESKIPHVCPSDPRFASCLPEKRPVLTIVRATTPHFATLSFLSVHVQSPGCGNSWEEHFLASLAVVT